MRLRTEVLLFATLTIAVSRSHLEDYKHEGHRIMKRLAEADEGFQEHDVAIVHLVEGQGQRRKRMAKADLRMQGKTGTVNRLRLGLSSGSKLDLALSPADIGYADTVVSFLTENGYEQVQRVATDCYFYGKMEDSTGTGWAAVSHCDGLFGFASSLNYEYFLHPVESGRSKRDAGDEFDVHVLWRSKRSENLNNDTLPVEDGDEDLDDDAIEGQASAFDGDDDGISMLRGANGAENHEQSTAIVIEMAMFSDEQFWKKLEHSYPGRENDFLLARLAGTQAMYADREKVGYDVKIKVKFLQYWTTNPANYNFTEEFNHNLKSFCQCTTKNYVYDVHALNTGITKWNNGQVGLAYVGGACTRNRCFVLKGIDFKTFVGFGHELGHTLGLSHRNTVQCPLEVKSRGFMGGGSGVFFAPCMKYKLSRFLESGKGHCLFTEADEEQTPTEYQSVPSLFPGQSRHPDGLCSILAGPGYKYLTNEKQEGSGVCFWFICLNEDKDSPEFLRAQRFLAPMGFPCKAEASCQRNHTCSLWEETKMTLEPGVLKRMTKIPQWSEWSVAKTPCSRSCGTGVRVRSRQCRYADYNLAPYCPGMSVKPELCNTQPCEGEPASRTNLRSLRRDEVCERFFNNGVNLTLKRATGYLPKGSGVTHYDVGLKIPVGHSMSCLMKCVRDPKSARGELDAVMPDGTLCLEHRRPQYDLGRFDIQMRCLRGHCHEFSDCPDGRQVKDACGICDGDGSRCFNLSVNPTDIAKGHHAQLTVIPPNSENIDVHFDLGKGTGVLLELWSHDDKNIIGEGGRYPIGRYQNAGAIEFAGTKWTYKPRWAYLRTAGPTNETVKIKALRKGNAVNNITIKYAKGD